MAKARCKGCHDMMERVTTGERDKYNKIIWLDHEGKRWHGKLAPCCYYSAELKLQFTKRKCRECGGFLLQTRHLVCEKCRPVLAEDPADDAALYGY